MTSRRPDDNRGFGRNRAIFIQGRLADDAGDRIGYVSDLSAEGMRMLSTTAPTEGRPVSLELFLPEDCPETLRVALQGNCVWARPAELPGYHDCGFRFDRLTREQGEALQRLLDATSVSPV